MHRASFCCHKYKLVAIAIERKWLRFVPREITEKEKAKRGESIALIISSRGRHVPAYLIMEFLI
jgi:hypothetical protein